MAMETEGEVGDIIPLPTARLDALEFQLRASDDEQTRLLGEPLSKHTVSIDSLRTLFNSVLNRVGNVVDLDACFRNLKKVNETFLPGKIVVRKCMRDMLIYFRDDMLEEYSKRVLLGSPGVGKSILFFIAAFYQAEVTATKPIIYVRNTHEEDHVSVFVMFRRSDGVQVYLCRSVDRRKYKTLGDMRESVAGLFGFNMWDCVVFLDGPRQHQESYMKSYYQYFCTSGGHSIPKNSETDVYLWLLDGWTRAEAVHAVTALGGTVDAANEAYRLFGGCMRDIMGYINGTDKMRNQIKSKLEALAASLDPRQVELVLTHTSRNNGEGSRNPDRLRMMFNKATSPETIAHVVQIVDSEFVLDILRGRLGLESYFNAMQLAKAIKSGSVEGVYFEEVLHSWFEESRPGGITAVQKATGKGVEGVQQLVAEKVYWIPSIPNFANIDAAVIIEGVLYAFQYTKRAGHGFNVSTFWQDFVSVVYNNVHFHRIYVYIVVMNGVASNLSVNFTNQWSPPGQAQTRTTATMVRITCASGIVRIDTTSPHSIRKSAAAGITFDGR